MLSSTWFNILLLILIPPVGILNMFLFAKWNIIVKVIIAIIMASYTLILLDWLQNILEKIIS